MSERLIPGAVAPDFTLKNSEGHDVSLKDYRGRNTVVYFYPAASTPGCTERGLRLQGLPPFAAAGRL